MAVQKDRSVGKSPGAFSVLYVATALLPGTVAALPIMMSSLPIMSSLESCKRMTLDFIIRDQNAAHVEDDIVKDLAKIGIEVKTRALNAEAYTAAEYSGDYNMLFGKTWGAPYDPHRRARPQPLHASVTPLDPRTDPIPHACAAAATSLLGMGMLTPSRPLSVGWSRH